MKTKIICTIGPAVANEEMIKKLITAGMSVARVNCSHGAIENNESTINLLKSVRKKYEVPLSIMLDTKGPDIRIGRFENGFVMLQEGQTFTFTTKEIQGNESTVSVSYKKLPKYVKPGQIFLINDGLIKMTVTAASENSIIARVNTGGKLSDRKSLFVPGAELNMPFISKEDELDLRLAMKTDCDYIAASFVNCAKDVLDMKKFMDKFGTEIPVIAKIESRAGIANIDEILKVADGIMVARGDLGVEFPIEQIPSLQKLLTEKAKKAGKIVITATEMLESMIERPRPTRAETTDVANSIYDGTSAIMLSGETAVGKYPIEAVTYMKRIAEEAEAHINYNNTFFKDEIEVSTTKEAFANTITSASIKAKAKAIVVFTQSGGTAIRVSRYHPNCQVYAFARYEKVFHQLAMINSVEPLMCSSILTVAQMLKISNDYILENKIAKKGEIIIVNASFQDSDTDLVLIHPLNND